MHGMYRVYVCHVLCVCIIQLAFCSRRTNILENSLLTISSFMRILKLVSLQGFSQDFSLE